MVGWFVCLFLLQVIGIVVDASCGSMFTFMCGEELDASALLFADTSAFLFAGQEWNALIVC